MTKEPYLKFKSFCSLDTNIKIKPIHLQGIPDFIWFGGSFIKKHAVTIAHINRTLKLFH